MKQRFAVGPVPVLIRLGWHPDAFTVLNPSNQPVYVREGSADSGVSDSNYDYVVPAGGNLQFPTDADNFSAVQAATADRPASVLLWTRGEVAPAFGGGGVASGGGEGVTSGYSFGTLAVTNAAVVAPTIPSGTFPTRAVIGPVEGAPVRYRYDGGAPTPTVGHSAQVGDTEVIEGYASIAALELIAESATAAVPYTLEH